MARYRGARILFRLVVLFLTAVMPSCAAPRTAWGVRLADWVMATWPDPWAIHGGGWEYNAGIVLYGVGQTYRRTGEWRYFEYVRRWVDHFVDAEGHLMLEGPPNLDLIQPGMVLLLVYEETPETRYRVAAGELLARLRTHPRNAAGGFWHKEIYPHEMWVDGIYMAGPFCVRYARLFGPNDLCPDEAVRQAVLLARQAQDPSTGLLRHAWDADGNAPWADPSTGLSPEVWGRGMGWYVMALIEMLQDLPPEHEGYAALLDILQKAAEGLERTQDRTSGLWHQVLDKGALPDNWLETSASAMFVYALKVGVEHGWLAARYERVARRGWEGLQAKLRVEPNGTPRVLDAVEGMGVQREYAAYVNKARLTNSTHSLAAVMLASSVMERPR